MRALSIFTIHRTARLLLASLALFTMLVTNSLAPRPVNGTSLKQDEPQTTQAVFTNPAAITINDATTASPYPSTINVSGLTGNIANTPGSVKVTLCNFSHTFPDDVGIVLVGPTGAALLIQDGAGDNPNMVNVTYALSDTGSTTLPDLTAWTSGTYKPTTYITGDSFPAPGPGMSYSNPGPVGGGTATFSSTFGGTNPNGVWSLYVFDFMVMDVGSFGCGWSLELNTAATPVTGSGPFIAYLNSAQEAPPSASTGTGVCGVRLNLAETQINVSCTYQGLSSNLIADHIHGNAPPGVNAGILFNLGATGGVSGTFNAGPFPVTPAQVANMRAHLWYINLHSINFPGGEIRGQVKQANTVFDADGDGRSDVTVFRQSSLTFYTLQSLSNTLQASAFGSGVGDNWLNNTCDFDGDGRGDPLLLRIDAMNKANWTILQSATDTIRNVQWGDFSPSVGDTLAINDYDGDGVQDIATYRRLNGLWSIIQSSNGAQRYEVWGASTGSAATGDQPCVGDYDGDGISDLTVVRNVGGQRVFYIRQSATNTLRTVIWGTAATDGFFFFAQIDVDGDGKQDIAVNRAVNGQRVHIILRSSDNQPQYVTWGPSAAGNINLFGDYDGDGKTDFVSRSVVDGVMTWNILQSSDGAHRSVNWGTSGDQ